MVRGAGWRDRKMRTTRERVVTLRVAFGRVDVPIYHADHFVGTYPTGGNLRLTEHTIQETRALCRTRAGRRWLRRREYLRKRGATLD